ncbi:ppsA [Symbiodinium pilosum]|uniref:PpsA protein n=1 Tax=Symbiodinium pilosum TaxID=2952 RepID=A0A812MLX7_SYMPI|nr:ppsA [Symbiodinium pilosum]
MAEQSSSWVNPAVATFQTQRTMTQAPAVRAVQEVYWQDKAQNKRAPPTPVASAAQTPQEDAQPALDRPTLVQPWSLEDHTASQIVASEYGVDINQSGSVEQWLATPVQTNKDVMSLELAWMAADNRQSQKHCALQIITSGWPQGMGPQAREYMLTWMLQQVPAIKTFLEGRGHLDTLTEDQAARWMNVLSVDPVTIPQGQDFWSGMTLLTFKSFSLRSSFLEKFGGQGGTPVYSNPTTPIQGRHVRVSPCSPQWQRKLESPLRVLISVLNQHPDYTGQTLVILWKTLTLMQPSTDRGFNGDVQAWGRLFYSEVNGEFKGRLEITPPMKTAMGDTRDHTAITGKGVNRGKGRRRWSQALIHNDYYSPYPFSLELSVVDQIAFCWDEYCQKTGKQEECVGDLGVATYQGKPPLPTKPADSSGHHDDGGDVVMGPPATTPPQAKSSAAAPKKGTKKGAGRAGQN